MRCELTFSSKIGNIRLVSENGNLVYLYLDRNEEAKISKEIVDSEITDNKVLLEAKNQIEEYLDGKRKKFDIPIEIKAAPFYKKVLEIVNDIPYGETKSYKEVAKMIQNPKAFRAVALANKNNPLPIIIPCHRVIGNDGKLRGYALGIDLKKKLLELETSSVAR